MIKIAYDIEKVQISGAPAWVETDLYDISAKPQAGILLTAEELRPCLQDLLRQRFQLVAHLEQRPVRAYALVVAKGGPHLTPTKSKHFPGWRIHVGFGDMRGENWSMQHLAKYLTNVSGVPVVDQTGITGNFDIDFRFNPDLDAESPYPPLELALKEATGLTIKSQMLPIKTLVIESINRTPSPN